MRSVYDPIATQPIVASSEPTLRVVLKRTACFADVSVGAAWDGRRSPAVVDTRAFRAMAGALRAGGAPGHSESGAALVRSGGQAQLAHLWDTADTHRILLARGGLI
jgi:hypothetical protein